MLHIKDTSPTSGRGSITEESLLVRTYRKLLQTPGAESLIKEYESTYWLKRYPCPDCRRAYALENYTDECVFCHGKVTPVPGESDQAAYIRADQSHQALLAEMHAPDYENDKPRYAEND